MTEKRLIVCVNERLGLGQRSCATSGSRALIAIIRQRLDESDQNIPVIEQVCLGRCTEGVVMRIAPGGPFFTEVQEQDLEQILLALLAYKPSSPVF